MRSRLLLSATVLALAVSPALATTPGTQVTIGNFLYEFEGATYDGVATTFSYCVTGLDNPGFHALSNWEMSLDTECIDPEDLVGCSPEPCFYQVNDPNTGITGIKFDNLEVDVGETECYSFSLVGDWTGSIDDVTVGLKAAREISYGSISGPSCQNCELTIAMDPTQVIAAVPVMRAYLVHNKETDASTRIKITVRDSAGNLFYRWVSKLVTFKKGEPFRWDAPIPGMPLPPPGVYTVRVGVKSMVGWVGKSATFEVRAP